VEDYIERVTQNGIVIRVNTQKNTYMLFKNNESIKNPRSKNQSIIHELPQVIFLGKEFEIRMSVSERIGFFEVHSGQVYIPFWIKGLSDVRHIKLPAFIDSDLLPVYVYHFQTFHVSSIPVFANGMNYFVVESRIDREMLIRLKMNFPTSRVIIYRGEKDSFLDGFSLSDEAAKIGTTRATDLLESEDDGYLEKNPSFAARVHLRRLHFEKVYEIPEQYQLKKDDMDVILGYLRVIRKKSSEQKEIRQNIVIIDELIELFVVLTPIFTYEISEVERLFDGGIPSQSLLIKIKKILKCQIELNKIILDEKKQRFYENVIAMLTPLIIE
jgi:hypothetical protein